tara:strand:- start:344 stop:805 length:462 start_codon:yes stop_codon:yes gene_type:complete
MRKKLLNLIQKIRKFFIWIWRQEGTPAERARGVALGVFSGCFPFFGFQTLIGISLSRLFKGNLLLAATATWISNPFSYAPLFWFNYKVGESFLGQGTAIGDVSQLSGRELFDQGWTFSSRLLLGSSIVGLFMGLLLGGLCYVLFKRLSVIDQN